MSFRIHYMLRTFRVRETERKQTKRTMLRCSSSLSKSFVRRLAQSHYDVLKVKPDCSHQEIRDAFVLQSKLFHPDGQKGNSLQFGKVMEAYKVLGKEETRQSYDYERSAGGSFGGNHINFGMNHPNRSVDYNPDEPYGVKGMKKMTNSKVVLLCAIFALVGLLFQIFLVRESLTFRRKKLDEKTKEAGALHAIARANAIKYGTEGQIERLREIMDKK